MKKLISLLLALVMILSLSTVAFADTTVGDETYKDTGTVNIPVTYKLVGAGTSPEETFTVTGSAGTVKDGEAKSAPALVGIECPKFDAGDAKAGEGTTKNIVLTLPSYTTVGVYEYILTPVVGSTAGVTYRPATDTIKLVVTVMNDDTAPGKVRVAGVHTETSGPNKIGGIEYTYSAGALNVTKTVTGNLGDTTKYFNFNVSLTGDSSKIYAGSFVAKVNADMNDEQDVNISIGATNLFTLKHGDTLTIENIPYGVTYTVTEEAADGYTTSKTGDNGSINADTQTAAFTNTKNGTVDTGVVLDTLPYVMILAVAAVCGMALLLKKRHMAD